MKKLLFTLKNALALCALAVAFTSCSKDDEDSLIGLWSFKEGNYIFYYDGQSYNAKEEGDDLSDINQGFRGWFFEFTSNQVTMGSGGQATPPASYTTSGNIITIRDGSTSITWRYNVSGNTLELTWTRAMMEMMMGSLPEVFYMFDEVEFVLTFNKVR